MRTQLLNYRLYFLSGRHITHFVQLEFASDEEAIEAATKHGAGAAMELWQGPRLVKRFESALED